MNLMNHVTLNGNGRERVAERPAYIERGGDLVARPPFMHENAHLRSFFLEADAERLQGLCDRVFNGPSGGALHFRPLGNMVLLTFAQIGRIYSTDEAQRQFGMMSEIDIAFWIPMLSQRDGETHLSWYIPYIFVDNPFAMATGREVYGFPKTVAQFQIPEKTTSREAYWVEAMALERFQPEARIEWQRIFEVVPVEEGKNGSRPGALSEAGRLWPALLGGGDSLPARLALSWRHLRKREVPILFLRQLRDIEEPTRAAYLEVIEAPARLTRFHRGGLLPAPFEVRFTANATFPIAEELGLRPAGHPVRSALWMAFDFLMDRGKTLWRAR
jgi:hypothetical protein